MLRKISLVFIVSFVLSYLLLETYFRSLDANDEGVATRQAAIIQEHVKERFKSNLTIPLSIGIMGADYFSTGDLLTKEYGRNTQEVFAVNKALLSFTIIDQTGRIVRVYPLEANAGALGKITQNYGQIQSSVARGEEYWLSNPFKLYQAQTGFAVYIPIKENGRLKGWFTPVISSRAFFENFELREFLKSYDLVIKDSDSGASYFETSISQDPDVKIYKSENSIIGRSLSFEVWSKDLKWTRHIQWYWKLIVALFLAATAALISRLYELRKNSRKQLEDISVLLTLTSKEALSSLVDVHNDVENSDPNKNVSYITNLIEQIDLLQTMAQSDQSSLDETIKFLNLIETQLAHFNEVIERKNLKVKFNYESLGKVFIRANKWLLQNSVVSNILSHSVIYAHPGSDILIETKTSDDTHFITFHTQKINSEGPENPAIKIDRRLEVAKRLLRIYKGEMYIQKDLSEGMIIRIVLPNRHAARLHS